MEAPDEGMLYVVPADKALQDDEEVLRQEEGRPAAASGFGRGLAGEASSAVRAEGNARLDATKEQFDARASAKLESIGICAPEDALPMEHRFFFLLAHLTIATFGVYEYWRQAPPLLVRSLDGAASRFPSANIYYTMMVVMIVVMVTMMKHGALALAQVSALSPVLDDDDGDGDG